MGNPNLTFFEVVRSIGMQNINNYQFEIPEHLSVTALNDFVQILPVWMVDKRAIITSRCNDDRKQRIQHAAFFLNITCLYTPTKFPTGSYFLMKPLSSNSHTGS